MILFEEMSETEKIIHIKKCCDEALKEVQDLFQRIVSAEEENKKLKEEIRLLELKAEDEYYKLDGSNNC